jgi:molybdate transport system permease protein
VTRRVPALLPLLGGLLALYLIAPLLASVQQASSTDWRAVDTAVLFYASVVSIASATVATLIIAVGGVPLGYLLARVPNRTMGALGFVVQMPLAVPPLASGVLLLFLVGYTTPIGRLTNGALNDSFAGIVLAEVFVAAPFLIIAARSAFAAIDPVLEGVAATLGRGPLEVFFRVSLPIAWPAILSGLLLAWLRAFGEFGATIMVAYHPYSLPVYTYVAFNGQGLPAMLPVLLPTLVLALAIMLASAAVGAQRVRGEKPGRLAEEDVPHALQDIAAPPARTAVPLDLALNLERRLGNFHLTLKWAPRSRRLAIIGPSGSGKSLTLKVLAGIDRCDHGSALLGGSAISCNLHRQCAALPMFRRITACFRISHLLNSCNFPWGPIPIRPRSGSTGSAFAVSRDGGPTLFRSASSNGRPWRARWLGRRGCCCSTSHSRRWTRRCARASVSSCGPCRRGSMPQRSW